MSKGEMVEPSLFSCEYQLIKTLQHNIKLRLGKYITGDKSCGKILMTLIHFYRIIKRKSGNFTVGHGIMHVFSLFKNPNYL